MVARRLGVKDGTSAGRMCRAVGLVLLIAAFYVATAPANHALAIDPYFYADLITRPPLDGISHAREMLWILAMQGIYQAAAAFVLDPDLFLIARFVNSALTAIAVLLLARILERDFDQDRTSAGLAAALFGTCYAVWRYSTEIEVYAPAVLASLVIVHATFASERVATGSPAKRTARLAALGAVATLVYQPIGFLPALAVPAYLAARGRMRQLPLYYLLSGAIVLAGYACAYVFGQHAQEANSVSFVFHANELQPSILTPTGVVEMAFAIASNLLSTHWVFAHEPLLCAIIAAPSYSLEAEIYAATRAGWLIWVPVVTLPAALALTLALVPATLRWRADSETRLKQRIMAIWLLLHATMMLILAPGGFEGWILTLVPFSILVGVRLVGPAVAAGRGALIVALLVVVLVHNLLAGLGIIQSSTGDYLSARGDPVLARTGPGDLILVPNQWSLRTYLEYWGDAEVLEINRAGEEDAQQAIANTLAGGGRVVVLDDVAGLLDEGALTGALRFATSDAGAAYVLGSGTSGP